jgi:hypothetical protein
MKTAMTALLAGALSTALIGIAYADEMVDHITCRAGTMTVLAKADDMIVWQLDHRGVNYSPDANNVFNGTTQRCIGVVASIGGKASGNGWCRNVNPKTGEWTVVDWQSDGKPGHGTWHFRYGSGKYKGISGGGTYEPVGQTRPVDAGTYQNCTRIKGTMQLPG